MNYKKTIVSFVLGVFLLCTAAFAQSPVSPQTGKAESDTQLLRELLDEMRALRQSLQTATINSQRAQILVTQILRQEERIEYSTYKWEESKKQIHELETNLKEIEEANASEVKPPENEGAALYYLSRSHDKKTVEKQLAEAREEEIKLQGKVRLEQSRLLELQDQLNRLNRDLDTQLFEQPRKRKTQ